MKMFHLISITFCHISWK